MAEVIDFRKRPTPKSDSVKQMAERAAGERVAAIDILRGLCVAGMILVAYAGEWSDRFKVLQHADWHALALADMIFPGFLVCAGMAIPLSFAKRGHETKATLVRHIALRALALIVLGVALNFASSLLFGPFRIPGILQRIGICYAVAGGLAVWLAKKDGKGYRVPIQPFFWIAAGVLAAYASLLSFTVMPDCGPACFTPTHSLPSVVDRLVFTTKYMWPYGTSHGQVVFDPEGLISTIGAVTDVMLGVMISAYLRRIGVRGALATLALAAVMLMVLGTGIDHLDPIIKKLWTPSFALVSGGFVLFVFVLLALIADVGGWTAWAMPLRVLGTNATAAFVGISVIDMAMGAVKLGPKHLSGHDALVAALDSVIPSQRVESLCYSLILLAVVTAALWPLYLKRWFLKF